VFKGVYPQALQKGVVNCMYNPSLFKFRLRPTTASTGRAKKRAAIYKKRLSLGDLMLLGK